jgi:hypothetical protein
VASAPVRRGEFTTDGAGEVRFVHGSGSDNVHRLYHRNGGDSWKLINDEAVSKRIETALGFSADDSLAYLNVEQARPDAIVSWNPQTGERATLLRDEVVNPAHHPSARHPCAGRRAVPGRYAAYPVLRREVAGGAPVPQPGSRLRRAVYITSSTRDGRVVLVETWSGSNPGDFYVYDTWRARLTT